MYSIRIRTNQRTDVLKQGDQASIGVLMRDRSIRYFYWGGFSFIPYYFEFWQGHNNRLNKRHVFFKDNEVWQDTYLQP